MSPANLGDVRDWLKALGALTAGVMSPADAETKLSAYAPLLAGEFGAPCFTVASLSAVARQCRFFPSFGEVCAALGAWWDERRPPDMMLIGGPEDAWRAETEAARAATRRDWQDVENIRRAIRSLDDHDARIHLGRMLAGMVGRHAPENLPHLPPEFLSPDERAERHAAE